MAAVVQVGLVTILDAITTRLTIAVPGLTASMVKLSAHANQVPNFDGEHDVVMRVGSFIGYDGEAAARTAQRIRRYLIFYPRTRMMLDPKDRDTQWLLAAAGQLNWEESILRAVWGLFPAQGGDSLAGDLYSWVELQMASGTEPVKGELDLAWGESALTTELNYLFALQQDGLL